MCTEPSLYFQSGSESINFGVDDGEIDFCILTVKPALVLNTFFIFTYSDTLMRLVILFLIKMPRLRNLPEVLQ